MQNWMERMGALVDILTRAPFVQIPDWTTPRSINTGLSFLQAKRGVHRVEAVAVEVNVDIVGYLDAAMTHEAGEDLNVDPLVVAVGREGMTEGVLTVIFDAGSLAETFRLIDKLLIGVARFILLKDPLRFPTGKQRFQDGNCFWR